MLTTSLRQQRLPWSYVLHSRAFTTSKVAGKEPQPFKIPSARLRALISLYHRSSTFITPANLSQRIDSAFTEQMNTSETVTSSAWSYPALRDYVKRHRGRDTATPHSHYLGVSLDYNNAIWSDKRGVRQARVNAALWGTEVGGKPALETVLETSAANQREDDLFNQTAGPRRS